MDFSSISNINSYIKTANMNHIWKQKADNPFQSIIPGSTSKSSGDEYKPANPFGDDKLMSIKSKMQSGQKLSSDDMDYLREHDPATYDEVIKMERERKEFQKELSRCKTKDDARMLHLGKVTEALTAAKSGTVSAEVALAKLARMTEAYQKFTESAHYSKMAENHSELAEAIEAEKAAITGEGKAKTEENSDIKPQPAENSSELQDLPEQAGQVEADVSYGASQSDNIDGLKPVEAEKPLPDTQSKTETIKKDSKPSPAPDKVVSKYSAPTPDVDLFAEISHSKFDYHV